MNTANLSFSTYLTLFLILFTPIVSFAQHSCGHSHHHEGHSHKASFEFIENKGQENEKVKFTMPMGGMNRLFIEEDAFTYLFHDENAYHAIHDLWHSKDKEAIKNHKVPGHAYKVVFQGAVTKQVIGEDAQSHYYNYFKGNDSSKWASEVPIFSRITHEGLYPNIDLVSYSNEHGFKYDLILQAGANPEDISMEYQGIEATALTIRSGHLFIKTSVGTTRESKPYAYQFINGKEKKVPCKYQLEGNRVSFQFPKGYDTAYELIIDPQVIAATMTGTLGSENFGHTAAFDNEGNVYAGGTSFGSGYPTSTGAFDNSFNGGSNEGVDMVVTKYNPTGTSIIYATYIGSSGDDRPHSMIVDFNNQLCILGSTDAQNFPITSNAYQTNSGGGIDITITKLNASGTALVGATYLGGNQIDGVNLSTQDVSYAEQYRGEIILDGQGNIYIASTSSSDNFPTTPNAFQTFKASQQDGIVAKLNNDLSTLFWASFIGGNDNDTAAGIRIDDQGNTWVTGTAGDSNFPMVPGGVQSAWPGGQESAYVVAFSSNGQQLIQGTFWGTGGNDHGYFLDIDEDNNIHILGTTTSSGMLISPGAYSFNPGSPQFITAFNNQLNQVIYSTTIGRGSYSNNGYWVGNYDFAPIAFMVDKCNKIYFSGYGARSGLPLTPDAFNTGGDSFYLGVLEPNATALSFGTYYGSSDHVDGGTSRFDKSGVVYQAVCSCDPNFMNTLAGAHAETQSDRCDIGVFKVDFEEETVTSAFTASPNASGCAPFTVNFEYTGQDGEIFEWQLEETVIANSENTSYTFTESGSYDVMLIAEAGNTCNLRDTSFLMIDVLDGTSTLDTLSFCPGEDFLFLDASTVNATYSWQDGFTGSTYSVETPGIYWVDINLVGCTQRDSFAVFVSAEINIELGEDLTICDDPSFTLDASDPNAANYIWNNDETGSVLVAVQSGNYQVTVTDIYGCSVTDQVSLIFQTTPVFSLEDSLICEGETVVLDPGISNATYSWSDGSSGMSLSISEAGEYSLTLDNGCVFTDVMQLDVSLNPLELDVTNIECVNECNGIIQVNLSPNEDLDDLALNWDFGGDDLLLENLCDGTYELTVVDENNCEFIHLAEQIEPDSISYDIEWNDVTCAGDANGSITVTNIQGGTEPYLFSWNGDPFSSTATINGLDGGDYTVSITDINDCGYLEEVNVFEPFANMVDAGDDKIIELGDSVRLDAFVLQVFGQDISWAESPGIWCRECIQPVVTPVNTTTYIISVLNPLTGCLISDDVTVFVEKPRNVFIPNVFTPNTDGFNDNLTVFANQGVQQIQSFRIYDRWGELVFEQENFPPNELSLGWNGRFNNKLMNPAVFVYVAEVEFKDNYVKLYKGDVTLVR